MWSLLYQPLAVAWEESLGGLGLLAAVPGGSRVGLEAPQGHRMRGLRAAVLRARGEAAAPRVWEE